MIKTTGGNTCISIERTWLESLKNKKKITKYAAFGAVGERECPHN